MFFANVTVSAACTRLTRLTVDVTAASRKITAARCHSRRSVTSALRARARRGAPRSPSLRARTRQQLTRRQRWQGTLSLPQEDLVIRQLRIRAAQRAGPAVEPPPVVARRLE